MPVVTERQITGVGLLHAAVCNASSTEANEGRVANPFLERRVAGRHFGPTLVRELLAFAFADRLLDDGLQLTSDVLDDFSLLFA